MDYSAKQVLYQVSSFYVNLKTIIFLGMVKTYQVNPYVVFFFACHPMHRLDYTDQKYSIWYLVAVRRTGGEDTAGELRTTHVLKGKDVFEITRR